MGAADQAHVLSWLTVLQTAHLPLWSRLTLKQGWHVDWGAGVLLLGSRERTPAMLWHVGRL